MRLSMRALPCLLVCALVALPAPAHAEGFFDLFAGISFTPKNDVELDFVGTREKTETEYKDSITAGLRGGYWFGFFGLNLDVSYFRPELDPDEVTVAGIAVDTDLHVVGAGLNAMLRGQFLKSPDVPQGRLQPYIFGGPTLFVSVLTVDVRGFGLSDDEADASARVGFTAGGGLTYMLTKGLGLFAEYRFTHNKPEFGVEGLKLEPTIDTHHVVGGVTFRF